MMVNHTNKGLRLFYSYAYEDEKLRKKVERHLSSLERLNYIETRHNRMIMPGTHWASDIDVHLQTADIILLLVSSYFIASDYCYGKEMEQALSKHEFGTAVVIPIILRPVDWQSTPFGKLKALPQDARPLTSWRNIDEGLADVAMNIRTIVEHIRGNGGGTTHHSSIQDIATDTSKKSSQKIVTYTYEDLPSEEENRATPTSKPGQHKHTFLTLTPEELIERYIEESLLNLKLGSPNLRLPEAVTDEYGTLLLPQVIAYENTKHLPISAFHFQVDPQRLEYMLPTEIKGKAEQVLEQQKQIPAPSGRVLFNGTTVRLNRIEAEPDRVTFVVSKSHYYDYIGTNHSIDARLNDWRSSLRDSVHPDRHLCSLEESLLENHIGLGALLFTVDDFLILPMRSKHGGVNIRPGEISPSVSGATNYGRDVNELIKTDREVIGWITGEAEEELNVEGNHIEDGSLTLLGVTRELLRGGKPEMFFSAQLNITRSQVEAGFEEAAGRIENSELFWMEMPHPVRTVTEQYLEELRKDIRRLLSQHGEYISLPMLTNLTLWYRYMQSPTNLEEDSV